MAPRGSYRAAAALLLLLAVGSASASGSFELNHEQRQLLARLQSETNLRGEQQGQDHHAGGEQQSARRLQQYYPAPKIPTLTPWSTVDGPSIDVWSYRWAGKMEDYVVLQADYPLENHKVLTPDGYILNMYRIPYGKYRNTKPGPKPLVLLQHGVTLASNSFVLLNANESMAYILADAGFDVWMSNSRGNTYSRGHKIYNAMYGQHYWRFSMDELALVDLPAQIDYALKWTGASKLAYVGHSQGCTLAYMLLADKVEYNDKISVVVHVGPVAFIEYFRAPFLRAQPRVGSDQWLKNFGMGEFLANRDLTPFIMPFCKDNKTVNEWCVQQLNGMFYGPSVFVPSEDYLVVGTSWPSSVSSRNLEHWAQMERDDKVELVKYSYGNDCTNFIRGTIWPRTYYESCNMAMYGTTEPPKYDLSKITTPQAFFLGTIDIMSTPEDVAEQQKRLNPDVVVAQYVYHRYSHMDFVWDRNALYAADLADVMFRFSNGTISTRNFGKVEEQVAAATAARAATTVTHTGPAQAPAPAPAP